MLKVPIGFRGRGNERGGGGVAGEGDGGGRGGEGGGGGGILKKPLSYRR